jgi:hypothetical protein
MNTQTTALKAKQRCPGCHSHAERELGEICGNCRQQELLCRLVSQLGDACETVGEAYAVAPHPAIAALKTEIVAVANNANKAVGIE